MTLGELIARLEKEDPALVLPEGFHEPHSYRGIYADLAFEPAQNISVASMLACAREALGNTYQGYKGGDFVMNEYVDVYLARYSECGEQIGPRLLEYMIAAGKESPPSAETGEEGGR
jgi:hypothetical protein